MTIVYEDSSERKRKYTPDVFVEFEDGSRVVIEVKCRETLINDYLKFRRLSNPQFVSQSILYQFEPDYH